MQTEKRRTTVYLDPEILEYLSLRHIKGAGSISEQLENLARQLMPHEHSTDEIGVLEKQQRQGYEKHPAKPDEFLDFLNSQVMEQ